MTFEEFQNTVEKKTAFDKYWYYLLSIAIVILSIILFYFLITQPERLKEPKIAYYIGALFLLCLGSSGFYFLPKRYKIVIVESKLPISKKIEITSKLLLDDAEFKVLEPSQYLIFILKEVEKNYRKYKSATQQSPNSSNTASYIIILTLLLQTLV